MQDNAWFDEWFDKNYPAEVFDEWFDKHYPAGISDSAEDRLAHRTEIFHEWFDKHYPTEIFDSSEDRLAHKKTVAVGFALGLHYCLKMTSQNLKQEDSQNA